MTQYVDNMRTPTKQWRYFVSDPTKQSWGAVIYIDSSGVFAAFSDYGTYGYRWTHPGHDDIRDFYARSRDDWDYFLNKFAPEQHFDVDGTLKAIRERIRRLRREKRMDRDEARDEWRLAEFSTEVEAHVNWYSKTQLEDAHDLARSRHDQQAVMFCKTILPVFADMLRTELAAERAQQAAG